MVASVTNVNELMGKDISLEKIYHHDSLVLHTQGLLTNNRARVIPVGLPGLACDAKPQ